MRIGERGEALVAFDHTFAKTVALGPRLDVLLSMLCIGLFYESLALIKTTLDRAKALLEEGGDWERRNRLKVYEAVFLILVRDFKGASALLLDSVATFTATELISYNTFALYTVLTSLISLPRAELKTKVVDSPEILQVIHEIPALNELLRGLYCCHYRTLMRALVNIVSNLKTDRYLHKHARYYWREARVLVYAQFMESYRSVSLSSMARCFGVSTNFLDGELSGFIATSRLSCKIDKVNGVIHSTRPDSKSAQYQAAIKQGDMLLNCVQKLSRVIDL
jgi:26S proteasome regulatory subunit N7